MRKFAIILIIFVIAVIAYLFTQGIFYPIKLKEQVVGDYWLVYQENTGPYEKVGPVIGKIYEDLKNEGIKTKLTFGLYYDDPKKVKKENLRSEVGAILEAQYYGRIKDLQSKYKIKYLKKRKSLYAEFPLKNDLSYMVGAIKVYPLMEEYCKEKNIDAAKVKDSFGLEIYDMANKKIIYTIPID
ncbi:MAG: hypothetical protein ABIH18_08100 [Candidatus Omnitrophota bacterium]